MAYPQELWDEVKLLYITKFLTNQYTLPQIIDIIKQNPKFKDFNLNKFDKSTISKTAKIQRWKTEDSALKIKDYYESQSVVMNAKFNKNSTPEEKAMYNRIDDVVYREVFGRQEVEETFKNILDKANDLLKNPERKESKIALGPDKKVLGTQVTIKSLDGYELAKISDSVYKAAEVRGLIPQQSTNNITVNTNQQIPDEPTLNEILAIANDLKEDIKNLPPEVIAEMQSVDNEEID